MGCPICGNLKRAYEAALREYTQARSSASYRVSTQLAARKNVEMERATYELEEHRLVCVFAVTVSALLPERNLPSGLRQLAA
jgi:hypothetical protein